MGFRDRVISFSQNNFKIKFLMGMVTWRSMFHTLPCFFINIISNYKSRQTKIFCCGDSRVCLCRWPAKCWPHDSFTCATTEPSTLQHMFHLLIVLFSNFHNQNSKEDLHSVLQLLPACPPRHPTSPLFCSQPESSVNFNVDPNILASQRRRTMVFKVTFPSLATGNT